MQMYAPLTVCIVLWQPNKEVTYASIDHSKARGRKPSRPADDYSCDYTTVVIPATTQIPSEGPSGDGCDNDYVLMN